MYPGHDPFEEGGQRGHAHLEGEEVSGHRSLHAVILGLLGRTRTLALLEFGVVHVVIETVSPAEMGH